MFEWFDKPSKRKKRQLISDILRRKPPDRYSLSDDPSDVNYLTFFVRDPGSRTDMMVERLHDEWVEGSQWDGSSYAHPIACALSALESDCVEIRHAYGPLVYSYTGWKDYRLSASLYSIQRKYFSLRFQRFFGSRFIRFSEDRFEILRKIVETEIKTGDAIGNILSEGYDTWDLYRRIYGQHVFEHPKTKAHLRRFELLVESLIHENALQRQSSKVAIGPNAMTLLSEYGLAKRRHRDSVWQNWILIVLTFVLIFATVIAPVVPSLL